MAHRTLIRSGKAPHDVLSVESSFARKSHGVFAANAGNLLFTNCVYRTLNTPEAEIVSDSLCTERAGVTDAYRERINDEFDSYVLPLANAFRESFRPALRRLTEAVRSLDIPVVVTGVGSQLGTDGDPADASPGLNEDVAAFVSAVLDRSSSIGVRGDITKNYLRSLGFAERDIDVIGCPSMFDYDGDVPVVSRKAETLTRESALAINITPHVRGMAQVLRRHHERFPDLVYVPQIHEELALLMWGQPIPSFPDGLPDSVDHFMYREDKIRFFVDPRPWQEFLATRDFVFGNRIHGNVAAITAGTPAVILVHDSRTLELADYHGIPYRLMSDVDPGSVDAAELNETADFTRLNAVRGENFERWTAFLDRNGLDHIHQPGKQNPEYARGLAETPYPGGVRALTADAPDQIASRLRWLWQGVQEDQVRPRGAYEPPFEPETQRRESAADIGREARRETGRLRKDIASLRREIERQKTRLAAQARTVAEHQSHLDYMHQPVEKRIKNSIAARLAKLRR